MVPKKLFFHQGRRQTQGAFDILGAGAPGSGDRLAEPGARLFYLPAKLQADWAQRWIEVPEPRARLSLRWSPRTRRANRTGCWSPQHRYGNAGGQEHVRISERAPLFGETEEQAADYAEELAAEMLATTLDLDFDPDKLTKRKKSTGCLTRSFAPPT